MVAFGEGCECVIIQIKVWGGGKKDTELDTVCVILGNLGERLTL